MRVAWWRDEASGSVPIGGRKCVTWWTVRQELPLVLQGTIWHKLSCSAGRVLDAW